IFTRVFGGNVVVKPVSCTLPSTHSTWVFLAGSTAPTPRPGSPNGGDNAGSLPAMVGSKGGGMKIAGVGVPETRPVYAFTSARAMVPLRPSRKSRGPNARQGENAPAPGCKPPDLFDMTSKDPRLTA